MSEDPFDDHNPIKPTTMEKLLRDQTEEGLQKESDIEELMKSKLDALTLTVWDMAMENAKKRDSSTVEETDVIEAFNEIYYPYTLLEEVADIAGEYERELRKTASKARLTDIEEEDIQDG